MPDKVMKDCRNVPLAIGDVVVAYDQMWVNAKSTHGVRMAMVMRFTEKRIGITYNGERGVRLVQPHQVIKYPNG